MSTEAPDDSQPPGSPVAQQREAQPRAAELRLDSWWDDLVAVALVGTARRSLDPGLVGALEVMVPPPPDGVPSNTPVDVEAQPVASTGRAGPEARLLDAAAVLGTRRRSGLVVDATPLAAPSPMPEDPRPPAPATALRLFRVMLDRATHPDAPESELVGEWLQRATARGYRLPVADLPGLAERASAPGLAALRPAVVAAGGGPLAWLAGQNRRWSWAAASGTPATSGTPADGEGSEAGALDRLAEQWRTGTTAQRIPALRAARRIDPAAAREMLASTWKGDKAADRSAALEVLAETLTLDDEPLLETALDDRAASVRTTAVEVLGRLVGSARSRRMADRLAPMVRFDGPLRRRIAVDAPTELDDAARRDGIVDAGAPKGVGTRAWWALQIVAASPLDPWETLGIAPKQVVERLAGEPRVLEALARAVERAGDPVWASALAPAVPSAGLFALLSADEAERLVRELVTASPDAVVGALLQAAPRPWGLALSIEAVDRLRAVKVNPNRPSATAHTLNLALHHVGSAAHPDIQPRLEAWMNTVGSGNHPFPMLRTTVHHLSLRRAINQELP